MAKKYEISENIIYASKDLKPDEHIVYIGMDIDWLLNALDFKKYRHRIVDVLSRNVSNTPNAHFQREDSKWYLVAKKNIRDGKRITIHPELPWFCSDSRS